jgi:hypothetical protein
MFVSRKEHKITLLRAIEISVDCGDVRVAQSLYERFEKHFGFNGKKYKRRFEAIREYLAYGLKIEQEFGRGALLKFHHPDIQKSIRDGIYSDRSIEFYRYNGLAFQPCKKRVASRVT